MSSLPIPPAVRSHARALAAELPVAVDADEILGGRAALLGLTPRGRISAGGTTRLLAARDGWCAITLSRPDDVDAIPALLESTRRPDDPWSALQNWVAHRNAGEAIARARLLGIAAATLGETAAAPPRVRPLGKPAPRRPPADLLVADLSSMWAGPLCGKVLAQAGATVVKVESPTRPDGTRAGSAAFFDWMNSGKLSYSVDFDEPIGLRALLGVADVVIESSRPAALHRRALGPDDVAPRDGRVWLRITGHGTDGVRADWVAFGDDAAVSGGLVGDGPVFTGDAIADPLTGLAGAAALFGSLHRGGGELIEMSMAAVAATDAALPALPESHCPATPSPPQAPPASTLGCDNLKVQHLVDERRLAAC